MGLIEVKASYCWELLNWWYTPQD